MSQDACFITVSTVISPDWIFFCDIVDLGLHVGRHELLVVVVLGNADGAVLEAQQLSRLPYFLRYRRWCP